MNNNKVCYNVDQSADTSAEEKKRARDNIGAMGFKTAFTVNGSVNVDADFNNSFSVEISPTQSQLGRLWLDFVHLYISTNSAATPSVDYVPALLTVERYNSENANNSDAPVSLSLVQIAPNTNWQGGCHGWRTVDSTAIPGGASKVKYAFVFKDSEIPVGATINYSIRVRVYG